MIDRTQVRAAGRTDPPPKPSCIRPRRPGLPQPPGGAPADTGAAAAGRTSAAEQAGTGASGRAAARDALDAVLSGVRLGSRERQFLRRLVQWDKRNAASVAALLWRARMTGREEAALTARQLDLVLGALSDAARYRTSGADAMGCWDCENLPGSRCAEHSRDADRARAYLDIGAQLSGRPTQADLPKPTDIAGYRGRTPVAS
jgi:hypothetical protein